MVFLKVQAFILLSFGLEKASASVAIGLAGVSQRFPGMCIDDTTGLPYTLSSTWQMRDTCGQKTCVQRGTALYISYEGCGYTQASPPCKIVEDLQRPYPSCCPRVVCEKHIENEINIDDYGHYDDGDDLYMMSSYDTADVVKFEAPLPALEDGGSESSDDYMIDWDVLFAGYEKK